MIEAQALVSASYYCLADDDGIIATQRVAESQEKRLFLCDELGAGGLWGGGG
jgi:hypothetical protein